MYWKQVAHLERLYKQGTAIYRYLRALMEWHGTFVPKTLNVFPGMMEGDLFGRG
jgi:hypothetical protein